MLPNLSTQDELVSYLYDSLDMERPADQDIVPLHIRWMIRRDMPEVLDMENETFHIDDAWDADKFIHELRQRNCIGMVAENDRVNRVVGYMIYNLQNGFIELINAGADRNEPSAPHALGASLASKLNRGKRAHVDGFIDNKRLKEERGGVAVAATEESEEVTNDSVFLSVVAAMAECPNEGMPYSEVQWDLQQAVQADSADTKYTEALKDWVRPLSRTPRESGGYRLVHGKTGVIVATARALEKLGKDAGEPLDEKLPTDWNGRVDDSRPSETWLNGNGLRLEDLEDGASWACAIGGVGPLSAAEYTIDKDDGLVITRFIDTLDAQELPGIPQAIALHTMKKVQGSDWFKKAGSAGTY